MNTNRHSLLRAALCVLPIVLVVACGGASDPEDLGTTNEPLVGAPPRVTPSPPTDDSCDFRHPYATADFWPSNYDLQWQSELEQNDCHSPTTYFTGGGSGVIGGLLIACKDTPLARAYVAATALAGGGPWSPAGYCDHALPALPAGQRYVSWDGWWPGPNCSGCRIGFAPW